MTSYLMSVMHFVHSILLLEMARRVDPVIWCGKDRRNEFTVVIQKEVDTDWFHFHQEITFKTVHSTRCINGNLDQTQTMGLHEQFWRPLSRKMIKLGISPWNMYYCNCLSMHPSSPPSSLFPHTTLPPLFPHHQFI